MQTKRGHIIEAGVLLPLGKRGKLVVPSRNECSQLTGQLHFIHHFKGYHVGRCRFCVGCAGNTGGVVVRSSRKYRERATRCLYLLNCVLLPCK